MQNDASQSSSRAVQGRSPAEPPWSGTSRYQVVRLLGRGAMGAVYEAYDRERGQSVALKTLLNFSPDALYRIKQEFRTLADVQHPNLVRLHELVVSDDEQPFFVMELVRGVDFVQYVHQSSAPQAAMTPAAIARLEPALAQLVEGVEALHAAGKLHRDIKPSNILVTADGRVVILDFGVATELSRLAIESPSGASEIVGSATYMAPEQACGDAPAPACDWYSVGVVLYEALVGRPPFEGKLTNVLTMKTESDPAPPLEVAPGVTPELDALCRALLDREPRRRPGALEILRRIGLSDANGPLVPSLPPLAPSARSASLVGREAPLAELRRAFDAARAGRPVVVTVDGGTGMGKSALAQHFLDRLVESGEATVLAGRAYERETVPYKAFDGVIDALSRHLVELEDDDPVDLPADIDALARIFPVLRSLPRLDDARNESDGDPARSRQRAFVALRETLASLSRRRPVVLFIDDVQWGDADSANLLVDMIRGPGGPPVLYLMTYRDGEAERSPFLAVMRERWPNPPLGLRVGPLTLDEGTRFASGMLDPSDPSSSRVAGAVARESGGSPFLIEELVRSNRSALGRSPGDTLNVLSLEAMVNARLARLSPETRRLVETVAVAGRPLAVAVASQASALVDGIEETIAAGRASRFLHAGMRDGDETVETSHDRFRETIVAQLSAEALRERHAGLARVLEAAPGVDAEAVAVHLLGAGKTDRAAAFAEKAADEATAKLAFAQAERLLRTTLDLLPPGASEAVLLKERLAQVLEWGGRGPEAARAYLEAAATAPLERRVELQRAAAEQLLSSGHVDEGMAVLQRVLPAVGLKGPRSPAAALFWLVVYRVWGAILGARYREPAPGSVSAEERVRIDALYAVAMGFSIVDVILGACMQARCVVMSLRAGTRYQALRAVSLETSHLASEGGPEGKRERGLVALAGDLLARTDADAEERAGPAGLDELHGMAFFQSNRGVSLFLRGRWREASEVLDVAYARTRGHHAGWQVNANLFGAYALAEIGAFDLAAARVAQLMSEAVRRGDLYTVVNLQTTMGVALACVADDPEGGRRRSDEAMATWSQRGFLVQHMQSMVWGARIDLYAGDGAAAFARTERDWVALKKSFLLHVQFIRGFVFQTRGLAAVAAAEATPARRRALLREARRMARRLARERMPWTSLHASQIVACVANLEGDRDGAAAALRDVIELGAATNMPHVAASARHRLGTVVGGAEGARLTSEAAGALTSRGVKNLPRYVGMYLPGPWT